MVTLAGQSLQRHIENSDVNAVTSIISNGTINLDERDDNGQTFLMTAAQQGSLEVVRHLLSCNVDVNAVDNDNWTALLNASKEGHAEIVLELLQNDADIEHKDLGCWTALTWACYKGRTDCAIILLEKGANPNVKGEHHMSCLTWAAGRGHLEVVKALLHHGAKINTADKYGTTPLIWAARKGHLEIVETLLDEGANVDNAGMNSWTALYVAAKGGYSDCVRAILACGPNVNAVDKDGFTALTIAAKEGHMDIVYNLLLKGAYVNLPDRYGDSILIHAVKGGHLEVVQALLERCADVDITGVDGKTALYWAIEKSHNDIAKAILESDPSLEMQTKDGDTALMKAVRSRNNEMVDVLLNKGAKVSTADKRGDTPLHISVRGRSKRITETLLRNPKDSRLLYRPNRVGETPYQLDAHHQKSILTQIFGTRQLNAEENIAGYDLYSSTIADVLSEPTLTTPITVGLYAKWGSGKSFLIDNLQKEMRSFTQQKSDPLFTFSWLQFFITLLISALVGLLFTITIRWEVGISVGGGIFIILYILLGFVWYGTYRRDWETAYKISTYLAKKLQYFQLLLQTVFCNQPSKPPSETAGVRFLFTDNARLASVVGEKSITAMIATLCDSLDKEYGMLVTRLFRVFRPRRAAERGRFKSFCCIPYFVIVIFVSVCIVAAISLAIFFGLHSLSNREYTVVDSILITLLIIVGIAVIGNCYTWGRMAVALVYSQQKRVQRIGRHIESLKMEGFMQKLKQEVEIMGQMVRCMDSFTNNHTRLVAIVDGLDSCEQDKLLQVLDTVHMLFGEAHSPFITVLAVDPHVVIKGIEHNLHGFFRDTSINGHDYLRNIVHLPFFLQIQNAPKSPVRRNISVRSESQASERPSSKYSRNDSVISSTSEIAEGSKKSKQKGSVKSRHGNSPLQRQPSSMDLSKSLSKNTYFSDVNPRNMRRLMNILAVTARILRACNIDFNWYRLLAWINVTEQWPYRLSWIILYEEDTENLDDMVTLKHIYEKVSPKMASSKEIDPLLEIDRNPRKLEIFLSNHSPVLNVGDLRKFLPCTINVDPYLRKLIREMQQAAGTVSEMALSSPYGAVMAPQEQNMIPWYGQSRPQSRLDLHANTSPRATPINHRNSYSNPSLMQLANPQMIVMQNMMQGMIGYQSSQLVNASRSSPFYQLKGISSDVPLGSLSVEGVCDILTKIEGLNARKLDQYCNTLHNSNINGMVLANCNLAELKAEMNMNFGDWELFRTIIQAMRERDIVRGQQGSTSPNDYEGRSEVQSPHVDFIETSMASHSPANLQMPIPKYPDQGRQVYKRTLERLESVKEDRPSEVQPQVSKAKRHSVTPPGDSRRRYSPAQVSGEYSRSADMPTSPTLHSMKKRDSVVGETLFESEFLHKRMENLGIEDEARDEDIEIFEDEAQRGGLTYRNAPDQIQLTRPPSRRGMQSSSVEKMLPARSKAAVSPQTVVYIVKEENVNITEPTKKKASFARVPVEDMSLGRSERTLSINTDADRDDAPMIKTKKKMLPKSFTKGLEKLSKGSSREKLHKPLSKEKLPHKSSRETLSNLSGSELSGSREQILPVYNTENPSAGQEVSKKSSKNNLFKTTSLNQMSGSSGSQDVFLTGKAGVSYERLTPHGSSSDSLPSNVNSNIPDTEHKASRLQKKVPAFSVVNSKINGEELPLSSITRDTFDSKVDVKPSNVSGQSSKRSSYSDSRRLSVKDMEVTVDETYFKQSTVQADELKEAITRAQEKQISEEHDEALHHISAFKVVTSPHSTSDTSSVVPSREASVENVMQGSPLGRSNSSDSAAATPRASPENKGMSPSPPNMISPKSGSPKREAVIPMAAMSGSQGDADRESAMEYTVRVEAGIVKEFNSEDIVQL